MSRQDKDKDQDKEKVKDKDTDKETKPPTKSAPAAPGKKQKRDTEATHTRHGNRTSQCCDVDIAG